MPDTTTFNAPDKPKINWLYVGGGIVGAIILIYLLNKNNSSKSGTVAAGTSINAALGSLEESALNLQGAQSFAQNSIDTLQSTQNKSFADVNSNIVAGNSGITDVITNDVSGINQSLANIMGQENTTYNYLLNSRAAMEQAFGANSDQVKALDAEIKAISSEMASGFTDLTGKIASIPAIAQPTPSSGGSSGGSSGPVHTYTVYLPGGGAIHTNASNAAAALNNVPGGHF